jgi:transaldolase
MKFFIDTADVAEIRDMMDIGLVDGVTTNPSLIMKSGRDFLEVIKEICALNCGPVSAEVTALEADAMVEEGKKLAGLATNVVVKLPLTLDGLKACRALTDAGIKTNVTLCFSANQGLLAAKAGATYISPFIGRLDDLGVNGMDLIQDLNVIYDNYGFDTQILAASIRSDAHVRDCALTGADVVTVPPSVLRRLAKHHLTDAGLEAFMADWKQTGQSILK